MDAGGYGMEHFYVAYHKWHFPDRRPVSVGG